MWWFWSPPFPPSKNLPGCFPSRASSPYPLSFLPFCLLSIHISVFGRPLQQRLVLHCPSVGSLQPSGWRLTNVLSCFPVQRPICRSASPPTYAAGGTWLGCGRRGEGNGAPCDGLESLHASAGDAWASVPSLTLDFPLRLLRCPYLYQPPPPLPLSLYNHTCPYTLPPNGRVFSWSLCAPLPRWTRPLAK